MSWAVRTAVLSVTKSGPLRVPSVSGGTDGVHRTVGPGVVVVTFTVDKVYEIPVPCSPSSRYRKFRGSNMTERRPTSSEWTTVELLSSTLDEYRIGSFTGRVSDRVPSTGSVWYPSS